jgi:hypothetical protein
VSELDYSGLPDAEQTALFQEVAISRHPEAAPFRDLLSGPSLESVVSLAEDIANRVKGGQAAEAAASAGTGPAVGAGAPAVHQDGPASRVAQEREHLRRNPGADWTEYLNAKAEEAGAA